MKRHIETSIKLLLMLLLVTLVSTQVYAQAPPDEAMFEPISDTPINTGIALMAAAGMGYGLKKLNRFKK